MDEPTKGLRRVTVRLVAEFGVIVLGVLTALAADGWVADRADRALEREYLDRLHEDARSHLAEIEQTASLNTWALQGAEELLELIESGRLASLPPEGLAALTIRASTQVQLNARLSTYEEMLGSGRLGLVRSTEIRSALGEYDRVRAEFENIWTYARGDFWQLVTSTVPSSIIHGYYETCLGPGGERGPETIGAVLEASTDCDLDLGGWAGGVLLQALDRPSTVSALHASMYYQRTSTQNLRRFFEPSAARLEATLDEELRAGAG